MGSEKKDQTEIDSAGEKQRKLKLGKELFSNFTGSSVDLLKLKALFFVPTAYAILNFAITQSSIVNKMAVFPKFVLFSNLVTAALYTLIFFQTWRYIEIYKFFVSSSINIHELDSTQNIAEKDAVKIIKYFERYSKTINFFIKYKIMSILYVYFWISASFIIFTIIYLIY
jgi:hypothetical protein